MKFGKSSFKLKFKKRHKRQKPKKRLLQDGYYMSECYKNRLVLSMKEILASRIILFETMFNLPSLYKKRLASLSKIEKSKRGISLS